jgi:hypothetical protein
VKPIASDKAVALLVEAANAGRLIIAVPAPSQTADPPPRSEPELLATFCHLFSLTRTETRLLVKLLQGTVVDQQTLYDAADLHELDPKSRSRTISVHVSNLRKKLSPHNIKIATVHGVGHCLTKEARETIQWLLAEHDAAAAGRRRE